MTARAAVDWGWWALWIAAVLAVARFGWALTVAAVHGLPSG